MTTKLEKLSASSIKTYDACQYKFKLAYLDKIPSPVKGNIHTAFGRSVHGSIEEFYKQNLDKLETLEPLFDPIFEKELKAINLILSVDDLEKFRTRGRKCLKNFYTSFLSEGYFKAPHGIELKFKIPYKSITIIGYIDFLSKDGDGIIVDYKTGKRPPTIKDLKKDVQLTIYSLAAIQNLGMTKPRLCLFYLDMNKKLFTEREQENYDYLLDKINKIIAHSDSDRFFEPNVNHCKWCEYNNMCQYSACKKFYVKF